MSATERERRHQTNRHAAVVRIIAGRYRGRKLSARPGRVTRPITDRVKETLFHHLEGRLPEARVLDVFAGTGTLGLEALSRGAHSAVFIEKDRRAFDLLRRNVEHLGVDEAAFCWRTDALRCSFRPQGGESRYPYEVVFFDPPYPLARKIAPGSPVFRSLQRLARDDVTAEDALLVFRLSEHDDADLPTVWNIRRSFEMSSMKILLLGKDIPA